MTIRELINVLERFGNTHGMETPVYTNGEPHIDEMEVSGVRYKDAETVENPDNGEMLPLWPKRVFLKV